MSGGARLGRYPGSGGAGDKGKKGAGDVVGGYGEVFRGLAPGLWLNSCPDE